VPQLLVYFSILLILCYALFLIILRRGLDRALAQNSIQNNAADLPFVSVIVAVHNECDVISKCLSALLAQDYPQNRFEVIVVDDASTDSTLDSLSKFAKKSSICILQNSSQEKFKSSKKGALEAGIQYARGDILLFTDADCLPPANWISALVKQFDQSTGLVAGFSPQFSDKTWLNTLLQIDAAAAAIVSAATIGFGRGVTCTGRHLAYRKQAWMDIGGFAALPNSLSGDDDFMLQALSKHPKWHVKYNFDAQAVVPARGPDSLREFLSQKQRHISAGRYYPPAAQIGFALFHLLNLVIWLVMFVHLATRPFLIVLPLFKFAMDYVLLKKFLNQFKMKIDFKIFMLWEWLLVYYNTITGPIGFFKKLKW
jgi:cellulose synthase/poly-beta-1,6-N-acetylglucosamine synthase-like glycosyltransferase